MITLSLEDTRWPDPDLEDWAERASTAVAACTGVDFSVWEVAILACADDEIAKLNEEFRGKPTPTNVLSWPAFDLAPDKAGDAPLPVPDPSGFDDSIGDIAIAYETCLREAQEQNKPFKAHVIHLLVHGMLHLLGYDHETDADAALMEGTEVRALASLGLDDPYKEDEGRP